MSATRRTRDQILVSALNRIDSPTLDQKCRPAGTIVADSLAVEWLQDGLDYIHTLWPFAAVLRSATVTVAEGSNIVSLAGVTDMIQDYKDGLVFTVPSKRRARRKTLDFVLRRAPDAKGSPPYYYVYREEDILVWPTADRPCQATLHYYSLPATLGPSDKPKFPSDNVLIDYVRLMGLEWVKSVPVGTAQQYAQNFVSSLQKAGLGSQLEPDDIDFDQDAVPGEHVVDRDSWMGPSVL